MKKLLLIAAAFTVLIAPAMAAEKSVRVYTRVRPVVVAAPVYSWTGFYVGGNVGYGSSHRDFSNAITGTLGNIQNSAINSGTDDGKGWLGGGQIGFNYQFLNNWVAGIEADIDAAHITSSTSACFTALVGIKTCGTRDTDVKDFGTVRGRLGYAVNNVLVYGTGGWAWGHGTNTTQINCIGPGCPGTSAVPPTSPEPARQAVVSTGLSCGIGRYGRSTFICNLMGSQKTAANRASFHPFSSPPMSHRTSASMSRASG